MSLDDSIKSVSIYRDQNRQYYLAHKDEIVNKAIARHSVNKERDNEYGRNWRKINQDKVKKHYLSIRLKKLAHLKEWNKNNPEKYKARSFHSCSKRRARIKQTNINPKPILDFVESVKSKPSAICYYCQKKVSTKHIQFDHMIPLSKGGMHSVENLCVSCDKCNLSKHDKLIADWMTLGQQLLTL